MLNPCCCMTPRIGTFIFGVLDFIWPIYTLFHLLNAMANNNVYRWIEFAFAVAMLIMAILLLIGAIQNSIERLKLWLILWIVFLICTFVFQVFNVYDASHGSATFERNRIGSGFLGFLIFLYEIWVVYAFIHELRYGPAGLTYCPSQMV